MTDYVGPDTFVALQKALEARQDEFARNPLISNGGRIMNILDPDAYGWENLRRTAEEDKFVGLTMVDRDVTLDRLSALFGERADFPYWQVFTGTPDEILPKCTSVLSDIALPEGWRVESCTHPDDRTIDATQALNVAVGVAPVPAYYLRGEILPSNLTCVYDAQGALVACASGVMRYHPQSKLARWMFSGGVCVHPDHRRKGLGTYVNAALMRDSHAVLDWTKALEQAKEDNLPSVAMIKKCGLSQFENKVTVVVNLTGGHITR